MSPVLPEGALKLYEVTLTSYFTADGVWECCWEWSDEASHGAPSVNDAVGLLSVAQHLMISGSGIESTQQHDDE